MLKSVYRIKKSKEFETLFKKGRFFKNRFFLLVFAKNNLDLSRFGFIVGKKVSKNAVQRNKVKRRAREVVRLNMDDIKTGYDIAFNFNKNAKEASYFDIKKEMLKALKSVKLLK